MNNVAHISNHERFMERQPPQADRKGAQLEDGYTRTANAIVEAFAKAPLTSREARVIRAIERATFGWNRSSAWLAASVLSEMTELSDRRCSEALNSLIRKKVLIRQGGSRSPVRINTVVSEWDFSKEKSRPTPKQRDKPNWGDSPQDGVVESPQNEGTNKDRKDIDTSSYEEGHTADAESAPTKTKKIPALPACPHMEILDLWAEIMPEKRQHARNLWPGSAREKALATRWKTGFRLKRESDGKPFYTNREEGIEWWGRFFQYLRRCEFLMDSDFVDLEWVVTKKFFDRILERKYEGGRK